MKNLKVDMKILFIVFGTVVILEFITLLGSYLSLSSSVMNEKKTALKETVDLAYSMLRINYAKFERGEITEEEAKSNSKVEIAEMRYGGDGKNYLWITNINTEMVMHPYKPELNGKDVSSTQDPNGVRLFYEMSKVAKDSEEGFVDYSWQWKDDATKVYPKKSFVKLFPKWGWIVGTGVYVNDVKEIATRSYLTLAFYVLIVFIVIAVIIYFYLRKIFGHFAEMLKNSATSISENSAQLATSNQDLSSRTQEQASSLEETASTLEEITATVKQTTDNSQVASQLSSKSVEISKKGGELSVDVLASMNDINSSSKQITEIVALVDEIAFQTNILAINAAIEAAKAGDMGKGFAVVAIEVRDLAQRSAEAAKEIRDLVTNSAAKVEGGLDLVNKNSEILKEIAGSAEQVADIMTEISSATKEQLSAIEQINKAVTELDSVTQQNSALVEEVAGASENMASDARLMTQVIESNLTIKKERGVVNIKKAKSQPSSMSSPSISRSHSSSSGNAVDSILSSSGDNFSGGEDF